MRVDDLTVPISPPLPDLVVMLLATEEDLEKHIRHLQGSSKGSGGRKAHGKDKDVTWEELGSQMELHGRGEPTRGTSNMFFLHT